MKLVVLANAEAPWSMMRRYIEYTRGKGAYFSWGAVQSPKGERAERGAGPLLRRATGGFRAPRFNEPGGPDGPPSLVFSWEALRSAVREYLELLGSKALSLV
jgi:hypothetical protein